MDELLFAVFLVLASFFLMNALLTLFVGVTWRFVSKLSLNWSAKSRAKFIFAFRLLPFVLSVSLLLFLFIPSFVIHEKENPEEFVSFRLSVLAFVALAVLVFAFLRALLSLLKTQILVSKWMREENRLNLGYTKTPVYKIENQYPMIAVFGLFKHKIFIDSRVFEILNDEEIEAVIAHEQAHINSLDNLKRFALNFCRNLTVLPFFKNIETAWDNSSEAAADEFASQDKRTRPLDLASALVKLARELSNTPTQKFVMASYISSEAHAPVAWRIERLISLANNFPQKEEKKYLGSFILAIACFAFAVKFLLLATHTDLFLFTHYLIEIFVKLLV